MDNKVKIREERISAEEYIYFLKRTDLGVIERMKDKA